MFDKLKTFIAHQQEWLNKSNDAEWFMDAHDALVDAICEDLEDNVCLYSVRWHQTENKIENVEIAYECLDQEDHENTVYFSIDSLTNASWIFFTQDEKEIVGKNPLELKNFIFELESLLNQLFPFLNQLFKVELDKSKNRIVENFAWNDYQIY